jgi:hypothetical protein
MINMSIPNNCCVLFLIFPLFTTIGTLVWTLKYNTEVFVLCIKKGSMFHTEKWTIHQSWTELIIFKFKLWQTPGWKIIIFILLKYRKVLLKVSLCFHIFQLLLFTFCLHLILWDMVCEKEDVCENWTEPWKI